MEQKSIEGALPSCVKHFSVETLTSTELIVRGVFIFPIKFCAYEGHFPGQPILPAIVQLAAARYIAESALKTSLVPTEITKMKFKGMVQPDDEIEVHVSLTQKNLLWQGTMKLHKDSGELLSSGNISYTESA
jgi:3-hydroxyacyl-[acyl-carrier-protein] dehydratase